MRIFWTLLILGLTINLSAQVEIPHTNLGCKEHQKNNFTYCLDTNFITQWTAICIKGSTIENKEYIPSDKEFFKDIPASIAYDWQKIEMQTRMWAMEFDSVYVVTGKSTIMVDSTQKTAYYKAILKGCQGDGLSFWLMPGVTKPSIKDYSLTINQLEQKTGFDFFPTLNKDLQEIFEAEFKWEFWPVIVD